MELLSTKEPEFKDLENSQSIHFVKNEKAHSEENLSVRPVEHLDKEISRDTNQAPNQPSQGSQTLVFKIREKCLPQGDSEIIRAATPTTGPVQGSMAEQFQRWSCLSGSGRSG